MEHLLRERNTVRFHQPSLIEAAKQMRALQNQKLLQAADNLAAPPQPIAEEVGLELAALFETARHDDGKVVCTLPIHKVSSLMEQQADIDEYDDSILSIMDFCTLLYKEGKIDAADYQRVKLFLDRQGQIEHSNPLPSIFSGPHLLRSSRSNLLAERQSTGANSFRGAGYSNPSKRFTRNGHTHHGRRYG